MREIVSAITVAQRLGLGNVYLAGDNLFATKSELAHTGIHDKSPGPRVWIDTVPRRSAPFSQLLLWSRNNFNLSSEVAPDSWASARSTLNIKPQNVPRTTLVIHLRGGDVFGSRDVRNYGQPPLAYYELVLDHDKPKHVLIVYQDLLNPVLQGLINHCELKGIGYSTQSGSLREDVETLLGAAKLVAGRGTFMPAIVGLSPRVEKLYFFEDKFVLQPPRGGFQLWRVHDRLGKYRDEVLSGNWENSDAQRQLMLNYAQSNLEIEETS